MRVQTEFNHSGVTVQLRASMLEQALMAAWQERFGDLAKDNPDLDFFDGFLFMAASILSADGLNWHRPPRNVDEDGIVQSYVSFMGQINMPFFNALFDAVSDLAGPVGNELDRLDEQLTDEEKKTTA